VKNLIPPFIQQQYQAGQEFGQLMAYTLNVDLSGFTPLTENLMQKGVRGAEELSNILNEIFEPLVQLVYQQGGFIPYFAGDAFTAIFPENNPGPVSARRVIETAALARDLFRRRENRFGEDYTIEIKSGLAYGTVDWGIVGDQLKSFYFRGGAIDQCAHCQTLAAGEEILVDRVIREQLGDRQFRLEEVGPDADRILGRIPLPAYEPDPQESTAIDREVALAFLPPSVVDYEQAGEFRSVVSVFINFTGLESHRELDHFFTLVSNQVHSFSGYLKEIDFGDKGAVIACFFGAPVAFENNVSRALEFVLTTQQELRQATDLPRLKARAGVTLGTAFTGIVGGVERCQYACVGNRVNLAARIMTSAAWGEVLVDEQMQRERSFRFRNRGEVRYRGISHPVPTFQLQGRDQTARPYDFESLIEREDELDQLLGFCEPIFAERAAGMAIVFGEAGIGKSRLLSELHLRLRERDERLNWLLCPADQILRKPFNPFIYFVRNFFEQSNENSPEKNEALFSARYDKLILDLRANNRDLDTEQLLRELRRTRPVLAALSGLTPRNTLWDQLDARGRYQNTIAALVNLILSEASLGPTIIELEDTHWIDEDSKEIIRELIRRLPTYPIAIIATSRYADDGEKPHFIDVGLLDRWQIPHLEIDLAGLADSAVRAFAERSLGGPITEEFLGILLRATNSNPFYLEQVLEYFRESDLLIKDGEAWTIEDENIQLSGSMNAILTSRIDRLETLVRETVKAAAVIGREFEVPVLSEVMRVREEFAGKDDRSLLREQISTAERGQIWTAMNELRYIFRHSLLREAAYNMQLGARLQELHHQIAEAIEHIYADKLEERYVDLAFHYEQAGDKPNTRKYLRKAADFARDNYQNQLALDYYDKLLRQLTDREDLALTCKILLKKGKVLELVGDWEEAQGAFEQARELAKQSRDVLMIGQVNNSLGYLQMLRGRYDEAMQTLQTAAGLFESIDDDLGLSKVYGNLGKLYFRRADYDKAMDYYERSLSRAGNEVGTFNRAETIAYLALTHMNRGQFERGIDLIRLQIPVHRMHQDKQGLATLHTNLGIVYFESGNYDAALREYHNGLELAEELGNKQLTAIAVGCLGSVYERRGLFAEARDNFERDLQLCQELGDKQGIAIAHGLLGELFSTMGEFDAAIEHLDRCLQLSEELGYRKGIAKAVNSLGDVHYFREQFAKSRDYYDRAIEITRTIDNKLVLGFSLAEKGSVLLAMHELDTLREVQAEAEALAEDLGNPDLLVESKLLTARTQHAQGNATGARNILADLLTDPSLSAEQQAAAYYTLYHTDRQQTAARDSARALYEQLHRETPKFIYRHRLNLLRKLT
jgi:predicted ATPase/class 3 adenylate cyclase